MVDKLRKRWLTGCLALGAAMAFYACWRTQGAVGWTLMAAGWAFTLGAVAFWRPDQA